MHSTANRARRDELTETAATTAGTLPRYVRAQVIAEMLDVSPRCVTLWAQQGKIPALYVSGSVRFDAAAVLESLGGSK